MNHDDPVREIEDLHSRIAELEERLAHLGEMERILSESEARFRALSEHTFEAIFLSEKGICTGQNRAAERMFGYSLEEAVGRPGTDWIAPEYREIVKNNILLNYAPPYEVMAIRKDGTTFPCEIQAKMVQDDERRIRVTSLRDITERKEAEKALLEANEKLERRVQERTADLQLANERLRQEMAAREEIERVLRASEEKYRTIFSYAPLGIGVADSEGRFTSVNRAFCDMLGHPEEELIGRSYRDFTLPQDIERSDGNFEALLQKRICKYRLSKRYVRKDGEIITALLSVAPLVEQNTKDVSVIGVIEDLTERERITNALRESEKKLRERDELFQAFMDNSPVVAFVKDEMGRYVYINKPWEKAFGRESSEVLGKTMQEVWPLESALLLRETDEVVLASDKPLKYDRFLTDPSGNDIHLWVYKFPLTDSDGNRLLGGLALDLTKQKNAEKALKQSEKKYRYLVETMNDGVGIADPRGVVTYVNDRFPAMVGFSREEVVGSNIRNFMAPDSRLLFEKQFGHRKKGLRGIYETVFVSKDGSPVPAIVSSTPLHAEDGSFLGGLAVITNISELKTTRERLLASLKEKEILLQEIHHRVKNNLQLVLSLLRLQARKIEEPNARAILTDVQNRVFSIALVHEKLYQSPNLSTVGSRIEWSEKG